MAITYLNRVVVSGTPRHVTAFRDTMRRTLHRKVGKKSWTERVPFSLVELARIIRMRDPESYAYEPYSMSVWPLRRITARRAEIRYQFQTRNLEIDKPLKRLSRHMPHITIRLMVHCLDDDSPYSFEMKAGRSRKHSLSDATRERYWEAARKRFGLTDDDVYDDDDAETFAEERMREDVLNFWHPGAASRQRDWWNRPAIRMMIDEMYLATVEVSEALAAASESKRQSRGRRAAS